VHKKVHKLPAVPGGSGRMGWQRPTEYPESHAEVIGLSPAVGKRTKSSRTEKRRD
jgi:hypothetical protein